MELLINLVKEKQFLYNPKFCEQFNDAQLVIMKDEAWQEIAKFMGVTKVECKSMWWSLRNDLKTVVNNRRTSWKGVRLPLRTKDFHRKYEKQMEFLLPYLKNPPANQVRKRMNDNRPTEIIDITSENTHYETMDLEEERSPSMTKKSCGKSKNTHYETNDENSHYETIDLEEERRPSMTKKSCGKCKLISDPSPADVITVHEDRLEIHDDEYGELIMEFGNEVVSIPAKLIEADETDDGDSCIIRVKDRPTGNIDGYSSSVIPIDLDLDIEEEEGIDIELPLEEILGDINIEDEVDLVPDPLKSSSGDLLNLVVKDKIAVPEKVCRCGAHGNDDEESDEQYYYSAFAVAANLIDNYRVRLELRKKVNSVVMETVSRYMSSKTVRK